jgi:WD40 repeat protein
LAELAPGLLGRWDPATGETKTFSFEAALSFPFLTISTDGRVIAARAGERVPRIQIWSMATRELEREFVEHKSISSWLAFSPDGKSLASAGVDHTIKHWDIATGVELLTLEGFGGPVWYARFSPDGKVLAGIGAKPRNEYPLEIRLWVAAEDGPESGAGDTAGAEHSK